MPRKNGSTETVVDRTDTNRDPFGGRRTEDYHNLRYGSREWNAAVNARREMLSLFQARPLDKSPGLKTDRFSRRPN